MSQRTKPPFRADQVGSLLRSAPVKEARTKRLAGDISPAQLKAIEDEEIRKLVAKQESIGLQAVTDGEFRRSWWHYDFLAGLDGVELVSVAQGLQFKGTQTKAEGLHVHGKIDWDPGHPMIDHFKFLKSVAHATPKVTIPSPTLLHFRGGREAIDRKAYPDMDGFYADLARVYAEEIADFAAAGCRYLQIDETNFAYLCDPALRREVQSNIGEDPDKLPHTYAQLLNRVIAGKPKDMVVCMHICRGNNKSAWVAEGGYEPVAEALFNEANVDGYFLEYDSPRAGDFAPLRFLPKGKIAVLGLVTTKLPQLERKDELKRRIDEAARYAPLDQLALSPQCGFASVAEGNKVTLADEIAKLRLVVEVAREVWG